MADPAAAGYGSGSIWHAVADGYADLDPGGLRLVQSFKIALGIALAVGVTLLFARAVPQFELPQSLADIGWLAARFGAAQEATGLDASLPAVAGIVAAFTILLHPTGSLGNELRWFALFASVSFALVSAVGLAGPGSWGLEELPVALLWIVLITFGVYARRWGLAGRKFGLFVMLHGVIFVVRNPTRELGFWYPAAAGIGLCVAFLVLFLMIRTSAVEAFHVQSRRFLSVLAGEIAACLHSGARAGPDRLPPSRMRRRWLVLQRYLAGAVTEAPSLASRYSAKLVGAYRMAIAKAMMDDAFGDMSADQRAAALRDRRLAGALEDLVGRLSHPHAIAFPSERITDPRLAALVEELVDPDRGLSASDLHLVRFVQALRRLEASLNDFLEARSELEITLPTAGSPGSAAAIGAVRRQALQALVASSITTILQFAYHLSHAYWATLTVALVLGGEVGATLIRSLQRTLGTAIGVLLAITIVPLIGQTTGLSLALILVSLPVAIFTIEQHYTIASAAIGFLVSMMIHVMADAGDAAMASRIYETAIGAGAALVMAWILFPSFSAPRAAPRIARFLETCRDGLGQADLHPGRAMVSEPLMQALQALQADAPGIIAERRMLGRSTRDFSETMILLDALVGYIGQYESGRFDIAVGELPAPLAAWLADLNARLVDRLEGLIARLSGGGQSAPPFAVSEPPTDDGGFPSGMARSRKTMYGVIQVAMAGNRIGTTLNELDRVAARMVR